MTDDAALRRLGWDGGWATAAADAAAQGGEPGRVSRVDRGLVTVVTASGPARAEPPADPIATGDWVLVADDGAGARRVAAILPRRSAFVRGATFEGTVVEEQIIAANVDTVFVVHALTGPPKLRRLERELVLVYDSGAMPVIVLTKADLAPVDERDATVEAMRSVAPSVDVVVTSASAGTGIDALHAFARDDRTVALIGASGVGKSTLVNVLVGRDVQDTGAVRARDQRGRHTTTVRELVPIPGGGVLVDTPGLRAVALWDTDEGLSRAFADVEELAMRCRFRDCAHRAEPGCAVRAAIAAGELEAARLDSYLRLDQDLDKVARRRQERIAGRAMRNAKRDLR